ncbi:neuropeptide-like protein 32 [Anopheles maculipalpis]|uniref:neuropeptide-like protein 32 n=1 Tax=Anopheles maculipalpis TaxID=1496333 RepID=UPI002158DD91|nr:neuropeptide-like protein 32 [Anopheles maculipalpis]
MIKLAYACLLVLLALASIEAVPVGQPQMDQQMGQMQDHQQDGGAMMMMMAMEDPMMMQQEQQPLTLEDMAAVYDQGEMDMGEMVREKRHHRYGGGYGGGYGGYRGGYGGFGGGYGGYRGGYGGGFGGHRGGYGGYRRGGYY